MKKILSLVLALIMAMSLFNGVTASAISVNDAVTWLKAQSGVGYDLDNYWGNQCSDFATAYMNWCVSGNPRSGNYAVVNANYYPTLAAGDQTNWEVIQNYESFVPQPGDIFVSDGSLPEYGHVGMVISSTANNATIIDQNVYDGNGNLMSWGYIHDIAWGQTSYVPQYFIRYKGFSETGTGESSNVSSEPSAEPGEESSQEPSAKPVEIIASGTCGDNLTWTLDSDGLLTISGIGNMYDYSYDTDSPFYSHRSSIKTVDIKYGVTSIGKRVFSECHNLKSVIMGNSVTNVGYKAFYNCKLLTSIRISNNVTVISEYAFENCIALDSIKLPEGLLIIGHKAFKDCVSLKSLKLPDSITTLGENILNGCTKIPEINYPKNLISGTNAFAESSVTNVVIPDGVTEILPVLKGCTTIKEVKIPDTVTIIADEAFYDCTALKSIEIPDSVVSVGDYAFHNCKALTEIDFPGVAILGHSIFEGCISLKEITLPKYLSQCEYTVVKVTGGDPRYYGPFYGSNIKKVTIPETIMTIPGYTFAWASNLKTVYIPNTVNTIKKYAFHKCLNLTTIEYSGTEEQWDLITIESYNSSITKSIVKFGMNPEVPIQHAFTLNKQKVAENVVFKMTFTQPKTVVASSLGLNIEFDNNAFEIIEIAEAPYADMQPDMTGCNAEGNIAISWCDPTYDANTEIAKGTKLLEVKFRVKEGATLGEEQIKIADYNVTGVFDNNTLTAIDITPDIDAFIKTVEVTDIPTHTLTGKVKAFGDTAKDVTIELIENNEVIDTQTVTGNSGTYTFTYVMEGDYTMRVTKPGLCTREYAITVADEMTKDIEINFYGDVNQDGFINSIDILQINRKIASLSSAISAGEKEVKDYRFKLANITALTGTDTVLNNLDTLQINRKVANLSSIFDTIA